MKKQILLKINQSLKKAGLSKEDFQDWQKYLTQVPDQYLNELLSIFETLPEKIKWFNEIIKKEKKILATKDRKAWQELLEEEKRVIEDFAQAEKIKEEEQKLKEVRQKLKKE